MKILEELEEYQKNKVSEEQITLKDYIKIIKENQHT